MEWSGVEWRGEVWSGVEWSGVEWRGEVWSGVESSGVEWSGVVWCDVEWSGVEWTGVEWTGFVVGIGDGGGAADGDGRLRDVTVFKHAVCTCAIEDETGRSGKCTLSRRES